jgi:uncharacterized repeat protein (TIGR01451 family)
MIFLVGGLLAAVINSAVVVKSVTLVSDPVDGAILPKSIPGAVLKYSITVTNTGFAMDSGTVAVTDPIPANTKLYVRDLGAAGSGPVAFSQGVPSSGMTYTYSSLSSTTDNIDFSNNNGSTYTYTPTPDANGYDAAVTNIRVRPQGADPSLGVFTLTFQITVK